MISEVERHQYWIDKTLKPRYPQLVEPFCSALIGYDHITATKAIDSRALQYVINIACSRRIHLYETGTRLLGDLATTFQEARTAILNMSADRHYQVRANALLCLNSQIPPEVTRVVVGQGLQDKSAHVRGLATSKAWSLGLSQLIPPTKTQILFRQRLSRDGFVLTSSRSNRKQRILWVQTQDGIKGRSVTQNEIRKKGIRNLVWELEKTT